MDQKTLNSDYTAILLAAGYGSRISALTDQPKCLLRLNGMTLLEKNFATWKSLGIKKVRLVLGYKSELIQQVAQNYAHDFEFSYAINEDYTNLGNTYSMLLGLQSVDGPGLIFDADLVYDASILEQFLLDPQADQILVGPANIDDIECAKTLIDRQGFARKTVDKRAISLDEILQFDFAGEAIGILKFSQTQMESLLTYAQQFLAKPENQKLNWEHLLNQFLPDHSVGIHRLKRGRWIEIDTPEDFRQAQSAFEA